MMTVVGLLFLAGPANLYADDKAAIQEGSAHSLKAASQAQDVFQEHKDKAGGELLAAAVELLDKAQTFKTSVQTAKNPQKDSRDEYWELVRHRRNLDAALSVSSLRKNKALKSALSALDQSLAELKPFF
jgi:hypothetical protein